VFTLAYRAHGIHSIASFTEFRKANAISGLEDSNKLRIPDFEEIVKVFNTTHRPPVPPSNYSW
jgi:hypothetical protein